MTAIHIKQPMSDDQAMELAEAFDARARDTAEMVEQIEGMDTTDVSMISSKALDTQIHNWGDVSHVSLAANPETLAYKQGADGFDMTMTGGLEVVFKDQAVRDFDIVVTAKSQARRGEDDDGIFGFRSLDIVAA